MRGVISKRGSKGTVPISAGRGRTTAQHLDASPLEDPEPGSTEREHRRVAELGNRIEDELEGDVAAARVLLERTDPVLRRQEISGAEGKPVEIQNAEALAAQLTTEELREIEALAKRVAARSAAGAPERRH